MNDFEWGRTMIFKPLALNNVENRIIFIPVEFVDRDIFVCRALQIISRKQNPRSVHHSPTALDVKSQVTARDLDPFAIQVFLRRPKLKYLHIRSSPTVTDRLAYKNPKLSRDSFRKFGHVS
jgi:hypothetical protein